VKAYWTKQSFDAKKELWLVEFVRVTRTRERFLPSEGFRTSWSEGLGHRLLAQSSSSLNGQGILFSLRQGGWWPLQVNSVAMPAVPLNIL